VNVADSEKQIRRIEGIISSMTPGERAKPDSSRLAQATHCRRRGVPVRK